MFRCATQSTTQWLRPPMFPNAPTWYENHQPIIFSLYHNHDNVNIILHYLIILFLQGDPGVHPDIHQRLPQHQRGYHHHHHLHHDLPARVGPGAKLEVALLVVEGKPCDVDLARRLERIGTMSITTINFISDIEHQREDHSR